MTLLYLDIDRPRLPAKTMAWIVQCCRIWDWQLEAVRFDKTRRGWHVIIAVAVDLEPALVVLGQAIMGSDLKREAFNTMRLMQLYAQPAFWRDRFNVLYVNHVRGVQLRNTCV